MVKSKAIEIIRKFSVKEAESFLEFIESPFFNKKKKLTEMFICIKNNMNKLDEKEMTEEILFSDLFKGKEFSYSFVRNLMSEMLNQCELFLVFNELKNNSFSDTMIKRILLKEYNKRFLDSHFSLKYKNIQKEFKETKIDFEYFDRLGKIEAENITFDLYRSSMENVPQKLLKRSEYHLCFIFQLLEFDIIDLTVNAAAFNLNFENELMFEFLKSIDIERFLGIIKSRKSPLAEELEVRLRLIKLSNDSDNTENYFKLKELIYKKINEYTNSEKLNMFIKLKNYCAVRIYKGDKKFYEEKYLISKREFESVKFNSEGVGPLFTNVFLEVVQTAVHKNETEYAEKLINEFSHHLEKSKQRSVHNLASAFVEFSRGNFENTLKCLSEVNAFNILMKNNSKLLYLKTYYEMNSLESGLSLLDSFIHYINETKELNESRKAALKKNYDFIRKLYRMKLNPEKHTRYDIDKVKEEIESSGINFNEWYICKLDELRKSVKK
jgi:hypothetical protein